MILSHRHRHFYISLLLAGILPIIFIAGLLGRPPTPTVGEDTQDIFAAANFPTTPSPSSVKRTLSVRGIDVTAEFIKLSQGSSSLRLQPSKALPFANPVVYWHPEEADAITSESVLLGQLSGTSARQFPLPNPSGSLLFYSLGQEQAIASVPLSLRDDL